MWKNVSYLICRTLVIWAVAGVLMILLCSQTTLERQADSLLVVAVEQCQKGNDAQAAELLAQACRLNPDNDAVQYYLGCLALSSNDVKSAAARFERAHSLDSTNVWYGMRLFSSLSDIYLQEGKYDEADSALNHLEKLSGPSEYISFSRLELNRQKGDFKTFFSNLNNIFSNELLQASAKRDIMERLLRGSDPRFNYFHLNDYDSLLTTCLRVHPRDTSITHFAGDFYFSARRSESLEDLCLQNKDDVHLLSLATYDKIRNKDYKSALELCNRLLARHELGNNRQGIVETLTVRGDCYTSLDMKRKAIADYETALEMDPGNIVTLNNYAYYLSVLGRKLSKALEMSRRAVQTEPENLSYMDTYAWILYRLKKYEDARAVFKRAMIYGGKDSPEVLRHYAATLEALGETALAEVYRQQAIIKENGKK